MPLKVNVGVSRKLGLPDDSSVGASCHLEVELDSALLYDDLDGFHAQVRGVFIAAHQAVHDELARLHGRGAPSAPRPPAPPAPASAPAPAPAPVPAAAPAARNGATAGTAGGGAVPAVASAPGEAVRPRPAVPATPSQVKAICSFARARNVDLAGLLRREYGVARPEDLSLALASQLLDEFRAAGSD